MDNITKALESIVNGSDNFCCLCFNICDARDLICSIDEASIVINNNNENVVMSDLILTTLGSNFTQYIETLDNFCESCAKALINSYTFIQTCNLNASLLSDALKGLSSGIQNITKPEGTKSLYVSLSLGNFSSQFIYDNQHILSPETALKRFLAISSPKIKEEPKPIEKTNKYITKDSDMLHDSTNGHILRCKHCLKMYRSMTNLRNHFTKVHAENKGNCYVQPKNCGQNIPSNKSLSQSRMACKECGKTFNNLNSLKMHQMSHEMTIVCQDCGRTYKNKVTYKNHLQLNICKQERRHSPSDGKYTCDYCKKKYTQKVSLRVHIQFEHGNYKAHICEWCGKKFWAQSRLKAHIVKHTRERNFSCPICTRKFVTKESLLYHTRLHTGEKPYKCPECSSRFLSASRRSDHVKRYHNGAKPGLKCDVCHGKFRSGDVLLKHKKTHEEKLNIKTDMVPPKINSKIYNLKVEGNKSKELDMKQKFSKVDQKCVYQDSVETFFVQNFTQGA